MAYVIDYTKLNRSKKRHIETCPNCHKNGHKGEDRVTHTFYFIHKTDASKALPIEICREVN